MFTTNVIMTQCPISSHNAIFLKRFLDFNRNAELNIVEEISEFKD